MASLNKVILLGNVTRDPELRYVSNGTPVTEIGLAVNNRRKGPNGEWVDETTFVDVTFWSRDAEIAGADVTKGSPLMIEGRLTLDTWAKDGMKNSKLRVVGEGLEYVPQAGVDHLICQPQYEPEHVLRVAMALRQQVNILISSLGRAQRPHPQHALAAAGGHLAGHPDPVALFKLPRKPVGFIEDDCRDGAGGITKGERQIRRALARHAAFLAPHGEHPLNGAAWFQSGHRPDPNDPVRGR